jgi:DNA-binding response OmpR family regulator
VPADGAASEISTPRLAEFGQDAPDAPVLKVAILDSDSGFLVVLAKRMERLGWKHRVLSPRVTTRTLGSLQADALVVDLALLGANRWTWLARLCEQRPDVRVIVCAGNSTVAERVCALRLGADDWLAKPCHPEELVARIEAVTSTRRQPEPRDLEPMTMGEVEVRPDLYQAFVRGRNLRLTRREYQLIELLSRAAARGDLSMPVGLHDGPQRPLGGRVRAQAASQAGKGVPGLALHSHALRDRLPAGRRAR